VGVQTRERSATGEMRSRTRETGNGRPFSICRRRSPPRYVHDEERAALDGSEVVDRDDVGVTNRAINSASRGSGRPAQRVPSRTIARILRATGAERRLSGEIDFTMPPLPIGRTIS